jgi:large subunit ribosomal protein L6
MVKTMIFDDEIEIPEGVSIKIDNNNQITVEGPNGGPITKNLSHIRGLNIFLEDNKLKFVSHFPKNNTLALAKTVMNLINNLIIGVQTNYKYFCKICYSHFPFTAEVKPDKNQIHVINFLGERAPRKARYLPHVKVDLDGDDIILNGPDKESLGQVAANLKRVCRIRKKDPRVFQDGIYLYKKQIGEKVIWQIK